MARKKRETMRQRQMRLRAEQQAAKKRASALTKTKTSKPTSTRVEKVKVKDVTPPKTQLKIKGKTSTPPKALPKGKAGGALGRAVRGVKGVGPNAAVGKLIGKVATPVAAAGEVKEMRDRAKRDRERNIKTGNTPFRGSGNYRRAAEAREGTTGRDRQGRRVKKVQGLPADYKATEAKAFQTAAKSKPTVKASAPAAKQPVVKGKATPKTAAPKTVQGQSKNMDENYRRWAAANPTLAKKVKKGQAGYEVIKGSKPKAPASKKGSTSPSSAMKPASKKAAKPQSFMSLSEKMKKKRGY